MFDSRLLNSTMCHFWRTADKVLEIATGCGYQAEILGEIAKKVYSIEIIPQLAEKARRTLNQLGYENIEVKTGDGYQGWTEQASYDAIIVTAAPEHIFTSYFLL